MSNITPLYRRDGSQILGSTFLFPDEFLQAVVTATTQQMREQYLQEIRSHPRIYWLKYTTCPWMNGLQPVYTEWVLYQTDSVEFAQQLCNLCNIDIRTLCLLIRDDTSVAMSILESRLVRRRERITELWEINYRLLWLPLRSFQFHTKHGMYPFWEIQNGLGPFATEYTWERYTYYMSEALYELYGYDIESPESRVVQCFESFLRSYYLNLYETKKIRDPYSAVEYVQNFSYEDVIIPFLNELRVTTDIVIDNLMIEECKEIYGLSLACIALSNLYSLIEEAEFYVINGDVDYDELFRVYVVAGQHMRNIMVQIGGMIQ